MNSSNAVLYLRSSKDRSDVSIDAQRRELQNLAKTKGLQIVGEFADIVVSGKNENRPGFQGLLTELKSGTRAWRAVLMYDTSRLARNQYVAHVFRHDCKKHGVDCYFVMTPELEGIAGIILPAILHAVDEVHSFVSKEKGLAGMAENVRRGFRAGGRAPAGYKLEHVATGAVREGEPVTKSRLVPSDTAEIIAEFLRDRAGGTPRLASARRLGLDLSTSTLVCIEWNALTYAGHTVWNVANERVGGKYPAGTKRRPRTDWQIQRDTHKALITEAEAEAILARLETNPHRGHRLASHDYLLTGLLVTPEGKAWHGDGGGIYYRAGKGRKVRAPEFDRMVVASVFKDLRSTDFAKALARDARKMAASHAPAQELEAGRAKLKALNAKIKKVGEIACEAQGVRVFYEKLKELEAERDALERGMVDLEREAAERTVLAAITERDIIALLNTLAVSLEGIDPERMKDLLLNITERIVMDPADLTCRIHYKIPAVRGDILASPGRAASFPLLRIWRSLKAA